MGGTPRSLKNQTLFVFTFYDSFSSWKPAHCESSGGGGDPQIDANNKNKQGKGHLVPQKSEPNLKPRKWKQEEDVFW